ncbi:MAG: Bax inhibitor-1 family protein, partial [Acidobacteriota bacterium]
MSTAEPTLAAPVSTGVSSNAIFGRVMALVAVTVGFAALGVWVGQDLSGWQWFIPWLFSLGCLIGLNLANSRGAQGLALTLLFAFGLLLGISVGSTVYYYASTDSTAVAQAAAATALFTMALGAGGYATRRDLSFLYR